MKGVVGRFSDGIKRHTTDMLPICSKPRNEKKRVEVAKFYSVFASHPVSGCLENDPAQRKDLIANGEI